MTETLWKNCLIIAKDIRVIHVNFIVIAVICSEKIEGISFVMLLVVLAILLER
jgi:hypothetical protein